MNETPNIKRTHDEHIYLKEDRFDRPKEYFKVLGSLVKARYPDIKAPRVCDFGCATGEFLHYFKMLYPEARISGVDTVPEFADKFQRILGDATFTLGSVEDPGICPAYSYDLVFCLGTLQIFDHWEKVLGNLLSWVVDGGGVYVFGIFNAYDADVYLKYRLSMNRQKNQLEPGWNMISQKSVADLLKENGRVAQINFVDFEMPFDIHPYGSDFIRTWTYKDEGGRRILTNGLSITPQYSALEIVMKK